MFKFVSVSLSCLHCFALAPKKITAPVVEEVQSTVISSDPDVSHGGYQQEQTSVENAMAINDLMAEQSSESQSETSSESENEGTDVVENSPHSRDGDDQPEGDGHDPDASGSGQTVAITPLEPMVIHPIEDYVDEELEGLMKEIQSIKETGKSTVLNTQDLVNIRENLSKKVAYYHKIFTKAGEANRKMVRVEKKEAKSKTDKKEKTPLEPKQLTLNCKFNGKNFVIKVLDNQRLKQVREALQSTFPSTFKSGKFVKSLRYEYKGMDMDQHTRRNLGQGSTGASGWKISDGDSIIINIRARGGGKRGSSTRDDLDTSSNLIMPLTPMEGDHIFIKNAIAIKEIAMVAWLNSLDVGTLKNLLSILDNQGKTGNVIKLVSPYMPSVDEFSKLQD